MIEKPPETSYSLIDRAQSPELSQAALNELSVQYAPFIYSIAFSLIGDLNDARDVAQQFIADRILSGSITRTYEQAKGPFRNYLSRCVKNECNKYFNRRIPNPSYDSKLYSLEDEPEENEKHQEEIVWAQTVLSRAVSKCRERLLGNNSEVIWELYQATVINPVLFNIEAPLTESLSERYGLTPQQISGKLHNGLRAMRICFRNAVSELDQCVMLSDERTSQLLELLTSPGAFQSIPANQLESFGLSEIEQAIFLSKNSLATLVRMDSVKASCCWTDIINLPLGLIAGDRDIQVSINDVCNETIVSKDELVGLRNTFKSLIGSGNEWVTKEAAAMLYNLCIALGLVRFDERLTSLNSIHLVLNFEKAIKNQWIDNDSKLVFEQGIAYLKNS